MIPWEHHYLEPKGNSTAIEYERDRFHRGATGVVLFPAGRFAAIGQHFDFTPSDLESESTCRTERFSPNEIPPRDLVAKTPFSPKRSKLSTTLAQKRDTKTRVVVGSGRSQL